MHPLITIEFLSHGIILVLLIQRHLLLLTFLELVLVQDSLVVAIVELFIFLAWL